MEKKKKKKISGRIRGTIEKNPRTHTQTHTHIQNTHTHTHTKKKHAQNTQQ